MNDRVKGDRPDVPRVEDQLAELTADELVCLRDEIDRQRPTARQMLEDLRELVSKALALVDELADGD